MVFKRYLSDLIKATMMTYNYRGNRINSVFVIKMLDYNETEINVKRMKQRLTLYVAVIKTPIFGYAFSYALNGLNIKRLCNIVTM